jgi:hypothetical protein
LGNAKEMPRMVVALADVIVIIVIIKGFDVLATLLKKRLEAHCRFIYNGDEIMKLNL